MLRALGLLDWKLKVSGMAVPPELNAWATNVWVLPISRDAFEPLCPAVQENPVVRQTDAGISLLMTLVGLPLPQEASSRQPSRMLRQDVPQTNLRINPSETIVGELTLENSQCRG